MTMWWRMAVVLLLLFGLLVQPVQATSWPKLAPAEVIRLSQLVAIGRVTQALPAWETGDSLIANGMVIQVESYLGSSTGPTFLEVGLPGGTVCGAFGRCKTMIGLDGENYVGRRLLLLLHQPGSSGLTPVAGPNGIVRLADNGFTTLYVAQDQEDWVEWDQYLQSSEKRVPDPLAPTLRVGTKSLTPGDARASWSWTAMGVIALLVLGAAGFWVRRRKFHDS